MNRLPAEGLDALLAQPSQRLDLMRRYFRRELDEELLEALECRLIQDADLAMEFDAEQALTTGMRSLPESEVLDSEETVTRLPRRPSLWRQFAPSLAAAVLAAIVPAAGWWHSARQAPPAAESTHVFSIDVSRGGAKAPRQQIRIPSSAQRFVVRIPAPNRPGIQHLQLWRDAATSPSIDLPVAPDETGWASVMLDRNALQPGRYTVRWGAESSAGSTPTTAFDLEFES